MRAQVCYMLELVATWAAQCGIVRLIEFVVAVVNLWVLEDLIARTAFDWHLVHVCAMLLQEPCSLKSGGVAEITLELLAMRLHMLP